MYTRWGRVWQISSPYGVGEETGYTAQEDLKPVNSYNMGEGRTIRVWFFHSCISRPSLVLSDLSSLSHHNIKGSDDLERIQGLLGSRCDIVIYKKYTFGHSGGQNIVVVVVLQSLTHV